MIKAWDEIFSETVVSWEKHTGLIKSEGLTQKQNAATLQELQNEVHELANTEQPLLAIGYINVDKNVSTFEDWTIYEIVAD